MSSLPIHSTHCSHLLVPFSSRLIKVTVTSEWQIQVKSCLTLSQSLGHIWHSSPLLLQVLCWGCPPLRGCLPPFWQDPLINWSLSQGRVSSWASTLLTLGSLLEAAATLLPWFPKLSPKLRLTPDHQKSPLHCHANGSQFPQSCSSHSFSNLLFCISLSFHSATNTVAYTRGEDMGCDSSFLLSSLSNPSSPLTSSS